MEEAAGATVAIPNSSSHPPRIRAAPVRVVARICPGGGSRGSFQVAARVSDAADSSPASASVSFIPINKEATPAAAGALTLRKDCEYKLDYCYTKDDSYTLIFDNEVKHLLDDIFCGDGQSNACVITCGATAKTHLIMGSQDHDGLLNMAMKEILRRAKPMGAAVSISSYQVLQDNHVFDILKPKDSEVHVLEDATGRTHLKGLSRVDIKSFEEFSDLCCGGSYMLKQTTKTSNQLQARGHQGFVIYISKVYKAGGECAVSKINFLDLAEYVDIKQKNYGGGVAPSNSNKSLYAIMNVVQALNNNQSFIPYRPYKVTRILQDSLCKTSGAVLICCLDEVSCQDAVSTLTLASRSSQVVNEQFYNLSLGTRSCSKSNASLSVRAKNLSRSLLPSIQQNSVPKNGRTQFINSAVKATRTPTANKRSEATMHSAKKHVSSVSTSINMKQIGAKSIQSGRRLFSTTTDSSKEDKIGAVPTMVAKAEEVQSSLGMAIQGSSPVEDPFCPLVQGHSSSDLHAENSYADLGMTCSSDIADEIAEKTPVCAIQSSPKLSDRLKEISNSLKLLSTRPVNITKPKTDMLCAQPFSTDVAEPRTPAVQLKFGHAENLQESLKGRSTGIKKSLAQECLTILNSANKEQLKSLKGIGEKRANYILELREESPEPLKNIDELRTIIGMNKNEITKMMSEMILDL
ncbi:kinesin-like protein KIN-10B isoform X4 [Setaria viridis]|uniref:kinesin-like protein KIN-10B isoform X4 n=1 Tax=Setaria viridis TaxID=4556 RepID=UPI0014934F0C|nr:kinesin-like protein KIN-10B isoform X4 [Setaria viridis]